MTVLKTRPFIGRHSGCCFTAEFVRLLSESLPYAGEGRGLPETRRKSESYEDNLPNIPGPCPRWCGGQRVDPLQKRF